MKKKYLSITDTIKIFARQNISIDIKDIHSCTREQIIHPLIYIDSVPVHACELRGKEGVAIGFCFLSAYWDVGDEIIAIFDSLFRNPSVKIGPIAKKEKLINPHMFSWSTELRLFVNVPKGHLNLKPYSDNNTINHFIFLENDPFYLRIENLVISQEDLKVLAQYWGVDLCEPPIEVNLKEHKKKKTNPPNHHSKKRIMILSAASAIAYRYPSDISSGKSILDLIKVNKNYLFESTKRIPYSDRININLINSYLHPLDECDFNRKDYEQSEEEKLFGSALSIIFSKEETNISYRSTASISIAKKIFEHREVIGCFFDLQVIRNLLDKSFVLIS